jgi:uracil-DNA glycosylase
VLGALGATAGQAVFGSKWRVTKQRGEFVELPSGVLATGTIHPSAILRIEESEQREAEFGDFADDLKAMVAHI